MLLDYILSNCIAWHRVCHWYDVDEILDDLDMTISDFKKAKAKLIKYNIISVCTISKEEKKELRFRTKKVIVFNVYYKNWTIYDKTKDVLNEKTENEFSVDEQLIRKLETL